MHLADNMTNHLPRNAISFQVSGQSCAIEIRSILDIVRYDRVVASDPPDESAEALDLCGETIEVLDLRSQLNLPVPPTNEETCVLIVEMSTASQRHRIGLTVDKVCDVVTLPDSLSHSSNQRIDDSFSAGAFRQGGNEMIVLDVRAILAERLGLSSSAIAKAA